MAEGGSRMRGSSERRMTSGGSDVAEADFGKVGYGEGSWLDSESFEYFGKSSR